MLACVLPNTIGATGKGKAPLDDISESEGEFIVIGDAFRVGVSLFPEDNNELFEPALLVPN